MYKEAQRKIEEEEMRKKAEKQEKMRREREQEERRKEKEQEKMRKIKQKAEESRRSMCRAALAAALMSMGVSLFMPSVTAVAMASAIASTTGYNCNVQDLFG